jgi:hypothetical protein
LQKAHEGQEVQLRIRGKMIHVLFHLEQDSIELWVETHDYVAQIERMVFNQKPQLVTVQGFEKSWVYEDKETKGVTYRPKQVFLPSVKVWGLEVTDYTEKVDNG